MLFEMNLQRTMYWPPALLGAQPSEWCPGKQSGAWRTLNHAVANDDELLRSLLVQLSIAEKDAPAFSEVPSLQGRLAVCEVSDA